MTGMYKSTFLWQLLDLCMDDARRLNDGILVVVDRMAGLDKQKLSAHPFYHPYYYLPTAKQPAVMLSAL
jgi:hypothetical protein